MKSHLHIRSAVWTFICAAVLLAAQVSFGATPDRKQAQGQLLDHGEFLCANCFFGASNYYFCFAADNNKVLIGYQRIPVLNWRDTSKNYLTRAHHAWTAWEAPGQTVPLTYDDKHIWVTREDGKQVRLTQDYSRRDIFANNERCRDVDKAKAELTGFPLIGAPRLTASADRLAVPSAFWHTSPIDRSRWLNSLTYRCVTCRLAKQS